MTTFGGNVIIYNSALEKIGHLENSFQISYEKKINAIWIAEFSLPADDPKHALCAIRNYVEIFDKGERIDLFRIISKTKSKDFENNIITYHCEHVLATLIDDVMFQFHQRDNQTTAENINYVLSNQITPRWQLGTCDFSYLFSYLWESENCLGALLAIPKPFSDEYAWTWDTSAYPWTLNLVSLPEIGDRANIQIRYAKNLKSVETVTESEQKCTRLYVLGPGEGINQTTITGLDNPDSPAGVPYIDISPPGSDPISQIWTNRSISDPETLYATARSLLNALNTDRVAYSLEAADISIITGNDVDKPLLGQGITVFDDEGHVVTSRVVAISKPDLTGDPGAMSIEISNMAEDLADDFAQLAARAKIHDTYAQGATNMYQVSMAENCDQYQDGDTTVIEPLNMRFILPEDIARINQIKLWLKIKPYRAYHKETPQLHNHSLSIWNYLPGEDLAIYPLGLSDRGSWNALVGAPGTPTVATSNSTSVSTVSYHIYEQALSNPSVDVYVGTDTQLGSDNSIPDAAYKIGTFSTDQNGLDITDHVPATGAIYCIRIIPNQAMRIEATLHERVFIRSDPLN